jgi:hypothetical protein
MPKQCSDLHHGTTPYLMRRDHKWAPDYFNRHRYRAETEELKAILLSGGRVVF